jgi:hypothetical protein
MNPVKCYQILNYVSMIDKMSINIVTMVSTYQLPTHGHNVKSICMLHHMMTVLNHLK